ncbi:response regulator [bacterium (Candidatus Blackallbacteria) CG17_big_fil_post_rev_8_21_14_2_50_48_46]|uniref:Response regulator n=1 Tax=bacterium (Candidatus Blackallbacteria) CG17_big_fil_post_rev_8_21_14_2_50_48_46 TaxID=2014261 RepID=A0A2M7FXT1_9BACT|nr:MAG: response regulator [bacterium (Candidatus Blackallbacteria) CG18_big_fil_WC_8_21_14_2_50_49_26]PIW13892.1 MAG: response regulator [bacterium (Candidatus Blackallbacteria) CG17_big_fil_post_rev_8_21_14_2_50_48_46]PIW45118.1 MAG: response regulator [bacterium (Candidatus Blackallbacteria) CG13_big_fil_rev_8_21_14_2_50_49_14]
MAVMIVDDAVTARMMTKAFLQDLGFGEIHAAEHGVEALELIEELDALELVVVDWNMPYMTGVEFIRELRARPEFGETKVLMMTTETGMEKIIEALTAGADEYMMKPFTKDMLADKLQIMGVEAHS